MSYGHPLQFGTFITPTSTDPAAPVALAKLSERLGLDLVTRSSDTGSSGVIRG